MCRWDITGYQTNEKDDAFSRVSANDWANQRTKQKSQGRRDGFQERCRCRKGRSDRLE